MKDAIIDLVYNWKHSMSKENTKGTRGLCILVFVSTMLAMIVGLVSIVVGIVTHSWIAIVVGAVVAIFGLSLFTWVSLQ